MKANLHRFIQFMLLTLLVFTSNFVYAGAKKSNDYCFNSSGVDMVDTSTTVTREFAEKMKSVGVKTIARYYDYEDETLPGKRLRKSEIEIFKEYGFNALVAFQHYNNNIKTFENWKKRGPDDAKRALAMAREFEQPQGSAIYFGVDGDFVGKNTGKYKFMTEEVVNYFNEINNIFRDNSVKYNIGVYGSGETCRILLDKKLAKYCWLSHSHGFIGTKALLKNGNYVIEQLLFGNCGGRQIDFNIVRKGISDYGQFVFKEK